MASAYLEGSRALVNLPECHLDVHDVLGVLERELNLARSSIRDDFLRAGPPRLGVLADAVSG